MIPRSGGDNGSLLNLLVLADFLLLLLCTTKDAQGEDIEDKQAVLNSVG